MAKDQKGPAEDGRDIGEEGKALLVEDGVEAVEENRDEGEGDGLAIGEAVEEAEEAVGHEDVEKAKAQGHLLVPADGEGQLVAIDAGDEDGKETDGLEAVDALGSQEAEEIGKAGGQVLAEVAIEEIGIVGKIPEDQMGGRIEEAVPKTIKQVPDNGDVDGYVVPQSDVGLEEPDVHGDDTGQKEDEVGKGLLEEPRKTGLRARQGSAFLDQALRCQSGTLSPWYLLRSSFLHW